MKTLIYLVLFSAFCMTQGAQWLKRWEIAREIWGLDFAVQQTREAKQAFAKDNADNDAALQSYNEGTPSERAQTLVDLGLLTDRTAMLLRDPGALDEAPRAHTPAEMDGVRKQARAGAGTVALAMR